jgi:hypothetical protein
MLGGRERKREGDREADREREREREFQGTSPVTYFPQPRPHPLAAFH